LTLIYEYGACGVVPDSFKESCYFELVCWWGLTFGEDWQCMAELCEGFSNARNYNMCMLCVVYTLGNRVAYDTKEILLICGNL